jgi:homogentisate 1,2-dioxygenase
MLLHGTETTYVRPSSLLLQPDTYSPLQVPYKYDMTKFVNVGSISVDHIDPSIFCVLTAKSRDLTSPLADFLIFSPRWDVASRMS